MREPFSFESQIVAPLFFLATLDAREKSRGELGMFRADSSGQGLAITKAKIPKCLRCKAIRRISSLRQDHMNRVVFFGTDGSVGTMHSQLC